MARDRDFNDETSRDSPTGEALDLLAGHGVRDAEGLVRPIGGAAGDPGRLLEVEPAEGLAIQGQLLGNLFMASLLWGPGN